jgi:hypothetical protein
MSKLTEKVDRGDQAQKWRRKILKQWFLKSSYYAKVENWFNLFGIGT